MQTATLSNFVAEQGIAAKRASTPRVVYAAVAGLACLPIGLLWDISHHSSIGRDTFWTPAHILIQIGGLVPAFLFAIIAYRTTFFGSPEDRAASVGFWGARAPLGVWMTFWGCLAMLTSAPFDDWWHNTYGLDVKIISPPHAILGVGMLAVGMGVLLFTFSSQNRAGAGGQTRNGLLCAIAVGVMIALKADFLTEYTFPNMQRTAQFYKVAVAGFPFLLVIAARAARIPFAATIAAATYMSIYIFMILVLPLFPAQPGLSPIYHPVDHMVPPSFPLLLIVPAAAIDLLHWAVRKIWPEPSTTAAAASWLRKVFPVGWWKDWLLALALGAAYLGIMLAVQWHFSAFLLSDAADNRFFARDGHWPYFVEPGPWMNRFWDRLEDPVTPKALAFAGLRAFISARAGLWFGKYLLRLKR